jgi:hypothetical protein
MTRMTGMTGMAGMTTGRLALFAESLLLGLLMFVASLPVVTAFVALTAGCALLRDRDETGVGVRPYWRRLTAVARTGPAGLGVPVALGGVLWLDWAAVRAGVPGHELLGVLVPVVAVAASVLALRTAAAWRPGPGWAAAALTAVRRLGSDRYGTALLAAAVVVALVIGTVWPVVVPLALGQLALAAVAVEAR